MASKIDLNKLNAKLKKANSITATVMQPTYDYFKTITPVRTGQARASTQLNSAKNQIQANYPYAFVLDRGRYLQNGRYYGSNQASQGMSKPTLEYLKKQIKAFLRSIGK